MRHRNTTWIVTALLVAAAAFLLGRRIAIYVPAFAEWVASLGALGPIVFIAGYIVATVAFVPGSIMTLTGGALFGIVRGSAYVFVGATLGATAAFIVSRYVARGALVRKFGHTRRFRRIDAATRHQGRRIVFLLRLSPAVPFNALNYVLGLTDVRLRDYVIACSGMLPVIVLWVYYGRLIGDVAGIVAGRHGAHDTTYWILTAAGLAATIVATALITRAARRALGAAMENDIE